MRVRPGFTLVEVLLALGLVLVLVTFLGLFVGQVADSRGELRAMSEREALVTTVFDAIDASTATCIALRGDGNAGISGDETSLDIAFHATTIQRAFADDPGRVLVPGGHVAIEFDADSGRTALSRDDDRTRTMPTTLFALRFRYHDGRGWRTSWDSVRMEGLPHAIECSVWFSPWPDEVIPAWFPEDYGLDDGSGFEDEDVFAAFALDDADPVLDDIDDLEADLASGTRGDLVDEDALPRPDRIRIFAIPDAEQPDESTFFDEPFLSGELDPFDTGEDPIEVGGDDDG